MTLALKYRPKEFKDVVGQHATAAILSAMIAKDKLSQVLLFTGPSGVGKTSMARIVASQINSEGAQEVHEGRHPAVIEIDAASNGSVDAIRELKRNLNYSSAGNKVVIIDEVHSISDQAFDALLHLLEFPPKNVIIILCTTEPQALEPAIRHRCDRYFFKRASLEDLKSRLTYVIEQEGINIDDSLVNLIAQRSEGSFRESLMLLEQVWLAEITSVEQYNLLHGNIDFGPTLLLSAVGGPISALKKLEETAYYVNSDEIADRIIETIKDIMLLKAGITSCYEGNALAERQMLASKLNLGQLLKAMKIMWELQTKLALNDPMRSLEMAFSIVGEAFAGAIVEPQPQIVPPTSAAMSLDAMKSFQA